MVSSPEDKNWDTSWWWESFWAFMFYVILVSIAIIWRPIENNTRYAYAKVARKKKKDQEEIEMQPVDSHGTGGRYLSDFKTHRA